MRRQTFDRIKKTVSVSLAVLFVVSLTASAGAACKTTTTPATTGVSDSDYSSLLNALNSGSGSTTFSPSNYVGNIPSSYGYKPSSTNSGDLSSLFNSLGI
jgi:hypothetical protein